MHLHKWLILNQEFHPGINETGGKASGLYDDDFGNIRYCLPEQLLPPCCSGHKGKV